MVNRDVFQDKKYAIQYEQAALDLNAYDLFAEKSLSLADIVDDSNILDFCCGTGISTCKIFDSNQKVSVSGLDKSAGFLNIALLKFNLLKKEQNIDKLFENSRLVFHFIENSPPLPQDFKRKM